MLPSFINRQWCWVSFWKKMYTKPSRQQCIQSVYVCIHWLQDCISQHNGKNYSIMCSVNKTDVVILNSNGSVTSHCWTTQKRLTTHIDISYFFFNFGVYLTDQMRNMMVQFMTCLRVLVTHSQKTRAGTVGSYW